MKLGGSGVSKAYISAFFVQNLDNNVRCGLHKFRVRYALGLSELTKVQWHALIGSKDEKIE